MTCTELPVNDLGVVVISGRDFSISPKLKF
jgi:hypothetical protein